MRLVIIQQGDSCFGYVYEHSLDSCTTHFVGRFDDAKQELKGVSPGFIKKSFGHGLAHYSLRYDSTMQRETLSGNAKPKTTAACIMSFGMPIPCTLYRINATPDTTAFMVARLGQQVSTLAASHPSPNQAPSPDSLMNKMELRETGAVQTINTAEGILQCTIYDNGT